MLQKTLSIPKPRGELGKNGIAALDASHSAVAKVSNSDWVGLAHPIAQSSKARAGTVESM